MDPGLWPGITAVLASRAVVQQGDAGQLGLIGIRKAGEIRTSE
ncbi:MAG: hypothetical protein VKK98_01630 [Cyanobacteriota bacterium]|nr:hypothetical protein [Cyanobacteriota bacterium]